jgi:hypothetical protein
MTGRRAVLQALLGGLAAAACGPPRPPAGPGGGATPQALPLRLDPIADLVPAAGLSWLVDARPTAIFADPVLASAIPFAADRFEAFAQRHGGVDLRRADQVAVAAVGDTQLALARLLVDPGKVEAAFTARATNVDGRAVERVPGGVPTGIVRLWGTVGDGREQIAIFGRDGVALERGALGPLQAAVYFAEGRLKRSLPALRAAPLASAAARLGEAPLRVFAPGPFVGPWARGLAGLLGAATAAALRVGVAPGAARTPGMPGEASAPAPRVAAAALSVRLLLAGAWGPDAPAAADRLVSAFGVLAEDPLGRLTGLDKPVAGPTATGDPEALALDVALDPVTMSRGLRALTDAPLAEVMAM